MTNAKNKSSNDPTFQARVNWILRPRLLLVLGLLANGMYLVRVPLARSRSLSGNASGQSTQEHVQDSNLSAGLVITEVRPTLRAVGRSVRRAITLPREFSSSPWSIVDQLSVEPRQTEEEFTPYKAQDQVAVAVGQHGTAEEEPSETHAMAIRITNPLSTGGEVHFLLDGELKTLAPGATFETTGKQSWSVQFDRGADFGPADETLGSGQYHFLVSSDGWGIQLAD